jgi:hypothetical protein
MAFQPFMGKPAEAVAAVPRFVASTEGSGQTMNEPSAAASSWGTGFRPFPTSPSLVTSSDSQVSNLPGAVFPAGYRSFDMSYPPMTLGGYPPPYWNYGYNSKLHYLLVLWFILLSLFCPQMVTSKGRP